MVRLLSYSIIQESGAKSKVRLDKNDSCSDLRTHLTASNFFEEIPAVWINNPSANQIKVIAEIINDNLLTVPALVISTPGDSLDGRMGFTTAANKAKRIMYCPFIIAGDRNGLKSHLMEWQSGVGVTIENDALLYLLNNAPTSIQKIKSGSTKKDQEIYDLDVLESELDKLICLCKYEKSKITVDYVKNICKFDHSKDVWSFISTCNSGNSSSIYRFLHSMLYEKSSESSLWLLLSQIEFLIDVKTHLDCGISNPNDIVDKLSEANTYGKYLDNNWEPIPLENLPKVNIVNTYRVIKAIESCNETNINKLTGQYQAVLNALMDLRNGISTEIVYPYLALALSSAKIYLQPLKPMIV